jgi:hypothetical protein
MHVTHLDHFRRVVNVIPSIVELARHCRELEGSGLARVDGDTIGALVQHPIGVAVLTPRNRNAATLIARKMKNLIACDGSRGHKERELKKGLQEQRSKSIYCFLCTQGPSPVTST